MDQETFNLVFVVEVRGLFVDQNQAPRAGLGTCSPGKLQCDSEAFWGGK